MSSFYVGDKQISKLANTISVFEINGKDRRELAIQLFKMNQKALKIRYGTVSVNLGKFVYSPDEKFEIIDSKGKAQFFKSLGCYLYQCSEGKVQNTKLFHHIKKVTSEIAYEIAEKTAEYLNAEWE